METWRSIQRTNITKHDRLCSFLELEDELAQKVLAKSTFPLNLPMRIAEKMEKNCLEDPLLLQFVPLQAEEEEKGFADPVQDTHFRKQKRLLHKYPGRVLLLARACAMHCRFCFRRHFPYEKNVSEFAEEIAYIRSHEEVTEVILSGGDPLSLSNETLSSLIRAIDAIPHVKRIRFHTRFPIGIPERIDEGFLNLLAACNKQVYFALHCNHAQELDEDIFYALKKIAKLGIPLLSQTVLLRGVNDSFEALSSLFATLADNGILPYYLHQLDPIKGAMHFHVPIEEGKKLMEKVQNHLSGYAVPKYAQEIPGKMGKTLIF